jgi:hypothetical protein
VSENTYWRYRTPAAMQALNKTRQTRVTASVGRVTGSDGRQELTATVRNAGSAVAAMVRLSLLDQQGNRVLPTLYGDNYLWLLPGESRELAVSWPEHALTGDPVLRVTGYNTPATSARS